MIEITTFDATLVPSTTFSQHNASLAQFSQGEASPFENRISIRGRTLAEGVRSSVQVGSQTFYDNSGEFAVTGGELFFDTGVGNVNRSLVNNESQILMQTGDYSALSSVASTYDREATGFCTFLNGQKLYNSEIPTGVDGVATVFPDIPTGYTQSLVYDAEASFVEGRSRVFLNGIEQFLKADYLEFYSSVTNIETGLDCRLTVDPITSESIVL